jgi:Family of unknown function (DUF6527)
MLNRFMDMLRSFFSSKYSSIAVPDFPETYKKKVVYLIGDKGVVDFAALICPCGCKEIIRLNLIPAAHPFWNVRLRKGSRISIEPSVWRLSGCKSHFFLREGSISWADRL